MEPQVNKKLDEKMGNLKEKNKAAQLKLGAKYAAIFLYLFNALK